MPQGVSKGSPQSPLDYALFSTHVVPWLVVDMPIRHKKLNPSNRIGNERSLLIQDSSACRIRSVAPGSEFRGADEAR